MLTKWNPFANGGLARSTPRLPMFDDLMHEADRLFDDAFSAPQFLGSPAADIQETADEVTVTVDLPGCDPKALKVELEGDLLTVSAQRAQAAEQKGRWLRQERAQLAVARSFVLPQSVDGARCEAKYEHGVLTVTLPRKEEARPKSISVKVKN